MESFSANLFLVLKSYWTFRILSNVNDGASLRKYLERLKIIRLMLVVLIVFFTYGELDLVLSRVVLS